MAGAEGTVRGAFDLDVGPALRGVREYRREAAAADVQTRQLGSSIDSAFGERQTTQIRTVREEMGGLSSTARDTRIQVRDHFSGMRHDIERESASIVGSIGVVEDRLHALGRARPSIQIDIDGVTAALGQVELLHERLNALSRQRATPRVALGGGFGSGAGMVARSAGGGGGGGRGPGGGGIFDLGRRGLQPRNLLYGLGASYAQPLIGGAVSLAGSAGSAALGAGAVGIAGLAPLAAGVGGVFAVAKPAVKALQEVWKAQDTYTKAVRLHGRESKQAAAAQKELTRLQRVAGPGSGYAAQQARGFVTDWRRETRPAQRQFFGLLGDVSQVGRRAAPQLARDALTSTTAVRSSGTQLARFLAGTEPQMALATFSKTFARELPTAERSIENIALTFERLARAGTPFFHEANTWVERQTQGWRASTRDVAHVRDEMRPLVQSAKDWGRLTGDVFKLLRDIGKLGRPSGDSLVVDLDRTIQRWDDWVNRHPAQVRGFFDDTANSVRHIASALTSVVGLLNQLATALRPLGDEFAQVVRLASSLGLIGTPGLGGAVYGAYKGFGGGGRGRGGGGAGGGRVRGGAFIGPGGGSGAGGFGGAGGAAAMLGGRYLAAPSAYGVRTQAGGAMDERSAMLSMLPFVGARRTRTIAGFEQRVAGGLATPEAFAARYGNIAGARYAMPEMVASQRYGVGRYAPQLLARGRGLAAGAARGAAPVVLGMAALQAAGTPGTFTERAQAAANMATFGLIGAPTTAAVARQQGSDLASADIQRMGPANTVRDVRAQIARLRTARGRYAARSQVTGGGGLFGGHGFAGAFDPGRGGDAGPTQEEARRNTARVAEYTHRIRELRQAEVDLHRQRGRELNDLSRQRATQYGSQLGAAYSVYRRAGDSPQAAASATTKQIGERLSKTRAAGVETLGEASLAWARELRRRSPALTRVVDDVTEKIEARFRRMGKRVSIVNGDILTGSKSEWGSIRDAMSSATEQAKEKTAADFTAIQQKAIGSLRAMGFSSSDAQSLVRSMEQGGRSGAIASSLAGAGLTPTQAKATGSSPTRLGNRKARGGMIRGAGLMDTVPTPDGGLAAPGEAWIANRHTLARLSRATRAVEGLTAEQVIRGETRPHWSPMRYTLGGGIARGNLSGVNSAVAAVAQAAMGHFPALQVTSTTGGTHARNSLHYRHAAVDLAGGDMNAAAQWIGAHYGRRLTEGIHNPNLSVHDGQTVPASFWGASTWAEHANHIHVGILGGGGARGSAGLLGGGGAVRHVHLHGVGQRQAGVPGVLRQRAGDLYAKALQKRVNAALDKRGGGGDLSGFAGGGDATANMRLGRRMMLAAGFGADQWPALKALWTRESGWRTSARNPTSGAFGIPQALGHGSIGNTAAEQIRWGLGYIGGRYGSPSGAWAHEQAQGWYSRGGRLRFAGAFDRGGSFVTNGPTAFVAGEGPRNRRERVTVTPAHHGGGSSVTLAPGSVVVQVGGKMDEREAEKIGEMVVSKIIEAIDRGKSKGVIA